MSKHNVYINLPWRELGNSDVQLEVRQDGEKFGTITISKGAIEWYTKNARSPMKVGWYHFDKMMRDYCKE